MDQDVVVDALGKHLDKIEAYVNAITVLAVGAAWAGIRRSPELDALGAKFNRRHAFWALAALYLIGNMAILILFLRIGDLVLMLEPSQALKGASTLATHSWVLNPFSHFGGSGAAMFHSSEGMGLLIATWWLCNASLSTLLDDKHNRTAKILLGLFLAIGLGSMFAINRVNEAILDRARASVPDLYAKASSMAIERAIGTGLGIVVGGLIFVAANKLQARFVGRGRSSG